MKRRNFLHYLGLAAVLQGCGSSDSGVFGSPASTGSAPTGFTPPTLGRLSRDGVVKFGPDGKIYEAFPATTEVRCSDPSGRVLWSFLQRGRTSGKLNFPHALAIDGQGRTWVVDLGLSKLLVLDANGGFLFEAGKGQISLVQDIAIFDSQVFVCDARNHRIAVFGLNGNLLRSFGSDRLNFPRALALDSAANLHIVDSGANRLFVYSTEGNFRQSYGGPGRGAGLFRSGNGIAIRAQDGLVAVADMAANNLEYFSPDLRSLGEVASPGLQVRDLEFAPDGRLYLYFVPGRPV